MRTLLFAAAFVLLCANPTQAQKVGDRVVATVAEAKLKSCNDVVGCVAQGSILTVKEVNGDWFWVIHSIGNETSKGWIKRRDVLPLEKALDFFAGELRRNPTAELYAVRGAIWEEMGEYENAVMNYSLAVELDPENAAVLHCRGYACARAGNDEHAIADYTESIRLVPKDATAYFNRGNAWQRKGEFDKAIADYTESIRLDPSDGLAYLNRGQAWANLGEDEKARDDFAQSDRSDPLLPLALTAIVIQGNKTIATDEILKLIKSRPGQAVDPKQIKDDVRALVAKRWFFDVETRIVQSKTEPGHVLVFRVTEKPMLENLTYIGNRKFTDKALNEVHMLKVKGGYDVGANREAVYRIINLYRESGYPLVEVVLETGWSHDDREVIFRIDEGTRLKIRNILFEGNKILLDEKLREGLQVQPNAVCDHRVVLADREMLLVRYALLGRIQAKVEPERRTYHDDPDVVDIVYKIEEGRHFEITQSTQPPSSGQDKPAGAPRSLGKTDAKSPFAEQPDVRDIDRLVFEGIKTLDLGDIRESLRRDFDLALAAHPDRPLSNFLVTLKIQIAAGFQHSGFPDVAVKVAVDEKLLRFVVQVTEGRRCKCGDVKIIGASKLPVGKLAQALTEDPKPIRILWKTGGPAPCDDFTITQIRERLEEVAKEAGFLSSKFDVRVSRDSKDDTATLSVTVSEEGLPAVVGEIEVTGTKRDSAADVLKHLDLHTGAPFDSRLPYRLEKQLEKTGRYLTMDVTATASKSPMADAAHDVRDLHIKLREYADAPKLASDLPPAEQALVKLGEWLERWSKGEIEEDLVVTAAFDADLPYAGASHVTARMVIAPNRGQTIVIKAFASDGKPKMDLVFAAYPDRLVLAAPLRNAKLLLPNSAEDRLILKASGGSASGRAIDRGGQKFRLNLGTGWSSRKKTTPSAFEVQARFSPACLMSFAHYSDAKCELRDGIWVVRSDTFEMQIDAASGRLVSLRLGDEGEGWNGEIRGEKDALKSELQKLEGPLAAAAVAYDAAIPWKSRLDFFMDAWLDATSGHAKADDVESLRALSKLIRNWSPPAIADLFDSDKPPRSADDPFSIPSHLSPTSYDDVFQRASMTRKNLVGGTALPVYRRLVPQSSWLWTAGHDALLTWASDDSTALASLHKRIESSEAGPVGEWFLGAISPYLGLDLREDVGLAGIKRLSLDAFRRDYRPLTRDDSWLGRWFLSLARALRSLDEAEIRELGRLLPAKAPYAAAMECLHSLKNDPSETIEQALSNTLDSYWNDELRTALSASLRRITAVAIRKRIGDRRDNHVRPASAEVDDP